MQRYDDRDHARHHVDDDDRSWSGRHADEDRERWGRSESFGEGRPEPYGRRSAGRFGEQEFERGRYGGGYEGFGRSGGGYDPERFIDHDDPNRYSDGYDRGDFGRSGGGHEGRGRSGGRYDRPGQWGAGGYGQQESGRSWSGSAREGAYGRQGGYGQPFLRYPGAGTIRGPHTGRGPRGYRRSDERIREEVCERLTQHGEIDAADLEVDVHDGDVTLRGMVDDRRMRRMAEDAIEDVSGVRDVTNQIRVRQGTGGEHRGSSSSSEMGMGTAGSGSSDRLQLRRGMDVAGSDGKTIGKVKEVRDHDFLLERSMQRDVYVPFAALMRVTADRATLNVVGDRIDDLHWETPSAPGEPGWSLPTTGPSQTGSGQQTSVQATGHAAQRQPVAAGAVGQPTGAGQRYGQEMANDPRFRGRRWEEAEPGLRTGYSDWARRQGMSTENGDRAWERLHDEVRRAFDEGQQ